MELPTIQMPEKILKQTQQKHLKGNFQADNPFRAILVAEKEAKEENLLSELDNKTKDQKPDQTVLLPFQLLKAWQGVLESEPIWQPKEKISQADSNTTFRQLELDFGLGIFHILNTLEPQLTDPGEKSMFRLNEFGEIPPNRLQAGDLPKMAPEVESLVLGIKPDLNRDPPTAFSNESWGRFLKDLLTGSGLETNLNSDRLTALGTKGNSKDFKPPITITEEFSQEVLTQITSRDRNFSKEDTPVGENGFDVSKSFGLELEVESSFGREAKPNKAAVLDSKTEAFILRLVLTRLSQKSASIAYGPLAERFLSSKNPVQFTAADDVPAYLDDKKEAVLSQAPVTKSEGGEVLSTQLQQLRLVETANQKQVLDDAEGLNAQKEYQVAVKVEPSTVQSKTNPEKNNIEATAKEPVGDRTKGTSDKRDLLKDSTYLPVSKETTVTPKEVTEKILDSNKQVTVKEIPEIVVKRVSLSRLENEVIKLKLYPRELGEVRISLNVKSEVVNLKFEFENPISQKAVKEELPLLKEALESQGLELGEFSLGTGSFNRQGTYFSRLELAEEFSYLLGEKNTTNTEYRWPEDEAIQEKTRQDTLIDYRV